MTDETKSNRDIRGEQPLEIDTKSTTGTHETHDSDDPDKLDELDDTEHSAIYFKNEKTGEWEVRNPSGSMGYNYLYRDE